LFLEVEGLTKSFGGLKAVDRLDLSVGQGDILGCIGPNGSGKTTLFNLLTGVLKPDSGTVRFRGQAITGLKPHRICKSGISRTFQLVKPFTRMTAAENVMVGMVFGRKPPESLKQARMASAEILEYVGLRGKENVIAGNLTLPDRKTLEMARALATKPRLLLLDEVMAGLNPREVDLAVDVVRKIRDSGISVIMVEHIVKALMDISTKMVVINAGKKIAEGEPQDVVRDEVVIEAYLGTG
jgi:branched-chain amino acid transport system ATP-binding protein